MTFVIGDRVLETTTTTGVGTITLAGAVAGYIAFSAIATVNGDTFYYQISGGAEWELGLGTRASSTTFTRTTVFASSNAGALVNFSAGTKEVWMDATAEQLRTTINLNAHSSVINGSLLCSVSANAATFSMRTAAGSVPTTTDPVFLIFQNTSAGSTVIRLAAALSITVANGATLGFSNGMPGRVWLAVLLSGTTPELVVRNCTLQFGLGNGNSVQGFPINGLITTTAQAGAADDSAFVNYSVNARTNVPFFILGYFDWDDTPLATAGAWATAPDKKVMMSPSVPLPGSVLRTIVNATATTASASTATFVSVVAATLNRSSKCNSVEVFAGGGSVLTNTSGGVARVQIRNTTQAYGPSYSDASQASGTNWNFVVPIFIYYLDFPGTVLNNAYDIAIALASGGGAAQYPVDASFAWIRCQELMG